MNARTQPVEKIGTLEVVDSHTADKSHQWQTYLRVRCSECAKDPEMFGGGIFTTTKQSYHNGKSPCACSITYKWTEEQHRLRVKRRCDEMGYEVISYEGGPWRDSKTRVCIRCLKDGHEWSLAVTSFLRNNGCKRCNLAKKEKPAEYFTDRWRANKKFPANVEYIRLKTTFNGARIWQYDCPSCATDIYSEAGFGGGSFEATVTALNSGRMPCRCAVGTILTKEQQEVRIRHTLTDGVEFVRWDEDYNGAGTYFIINCKVDGHGESRTRFSEITKRKWSSCLSCSEVSTYKTSPSHFYILKIVGATTDFTGYGISCVLDNRIKFHRRELREYGFQIDEMETFPMCGEEAYKLEREVMKEFPLYAQEVSGFMTEATYSHLYLDVIAYAEGFLQRISDESKIPKKVLALP